jgi:hypothetical protein
MISTRGVPGFRQMAMAAFSLKALAKKEEMTCSFVEFNNVLVASICFTFAK